jgi:hypothetical protein
VDGTLIHTDRLREPGSTVRKDSSSGSPVDVWWSGKHCAHGRTIQVVTAPDGWPLWTSQARPGREHDLTALRADTEMLPAFTAWTSVDRPVLGDLGYEGQADLVTVAVKKPAHGQLSDEHKEANKAHNGKRTIGERGNSLCSRPR